MALSGAGITTLKHLSRLSEEDIAQLHGIGPDAIDKIKNAFKEKGLTLAAGKNERR